MATLEWELEAKMKRESTPFEKIYDSSKIF